MISPVRWILAVVVTVAFTTAHAQTNRVLLLDGLDDYLQITRPVSNSFTLEVWMNLLSASSNSVTPALCGPIYDNHYNSGDKDFGFYMAGRTPGLAVGNPWAVTSSVSVSTGLWTHIAIVRDVAGGIANLFINGTLVESQPSADSRTLDQESVLWIGRNHRTPTFPGYEVRLHAYLDECRFWSRALSQAEIKSQMFSILTGSEPGLVTYLNFDANNFNDQSASANNATASGSPTIVTTNFFGGNPTIYAETVGSVMGVQFATIPSQWYSLQYSSNIAATNWTDAGLRVRGDGSSRWFFDPAGFSPLKFYRVQIAPLYDSVKVAGTFSGWGGSHYLDRISPNSWQGTVTMTNQSSVEFKFLANDSWSNSWGEIDQADFTLPITGDAEFGTPSNILISGTLNGTYRFTFDDQYGSYSVDQVVP